MNLHKITEKLFIVFVLSASIISSHDFFNFKIFHETSKHQSIKLSMFHLAGRVLHM